jgi:hypothetical protein
MTKVQIANLVTFLVFLYIGWWLATRVKLPVRVHTWLLIVVALFLGSFVGIGTYAVNVFGVGIRVSWVVPSFCLGLLVRLLVRTRLERA